MSRLQQLAARRASLVEQAVQQRAELGAWYRRLERPVGLFDKGYALACGIRSHKFMLVMAGTAAMFLLRKKPVFVMLAGSALAAARYGMSLVKLLTVFKNPPEPR